MLSAHTTLPAGCQTEGCYHFELESLNNWPAQVFIPQGYEPSYPYPLLVLFHGDGGNEDEALRLAPRLSRRNYICLSLRGFESVASAIDQENGEERSTGHSWQNGRAPEAWLEEYLSSSIQRLRRRLHIHTERVYLVGIREGAMPAATLALRNPQNFAGLVSLNGILRQSALPSLRLSALRDLRIFLAHGKRNRTMPLSRLYEELRLLFTGGAPIQLATYPTSDRLHTRMLGDLNNWIMQDIDTAFGLPA